ncbi:MAG: hypothetical protein ACFB0C_15655 [Leptolyngbyaceae cyanobacterium]
MAFPAVMVMKREGKIIRFNEDELILHQMRRAPGAATLRVMGGWGSDDYKLYQDAIEEKLPIEHLQEASDLPINMQRRSVNKASRRVGLRLEYDQMTLLGDAAQYGAANKLALSGAAQWSHPDADIEAQMDTAHQSVLAGCGMMANTGIFSLEAFLAAKRSPLVRDKYKHVSANSITLDMVLRAFGLERGGISTAQWKAPDGSAKQFIFDNKAWIGYVPTNAVNDLNGNLSIMPSAESDIDEPSFGYTYTLDGYPIVEEPYYEKNEKSWMFPYTAERQPVLTGMGAGYLWSDVTV